MNQAQRCQIEILANETSAWAKRTASLVFCFGDRWDQQKVDKIQELLTSANCATDMALKYASGVLEEVSPSPAKPAKLEEGG